MTRRAHSHAARVAHARARRQRVAEYMEQKKEEDAKSDSSSNSEGNNQTKSQEKPKLALTSQRKISPSIPGTIFGDVQPDGILKFLHSLSPVQQVLFNHYVQILLPFQVTHCPVILGTQEKFMNIRNNWIFFAASDPVILSGFLLAACRYLSQVEPRDECAQLATQLKLHYLRTVAMTTVLAFDEIMCGDYPVAAKHVLGALNMIEAAGGFEALGLNDLVCYILYSLLYGKRLPDWDMDLYLTTSLLTPDSILS
ncbi:hypothetical protein FSARC_7366 [Fusarium sarcochroum]|uniref:Uncharacterized protein n=1 Tax=Fusarium sarcochroum TaxID=1208366 RepID=A0A8H4TVI3_9HYPO|nr:hypothetical protein FSARC_7366 [Fusarium sarcochroum]